MKFDAVVGNPPYHLKPKKDSSLLGSLAIYPFFVMGAKDLATRMVSLLIPGGWRSNGKHFINKFSESMLTDKHMRVLFEYENSRHFFPSVAISGGICFFLWDRHKTSKEYPYFFVERSGHRTMKTQLIDFDKDLLVVRNHKHISVVHRVKYVNSLLGNKFMNELVSPLSPFFISSNQAFVPWAPEKDRITLFARDGQGPFLRSAVKRGHWMIDKWKLLTTQTCTSHMNKKWFPCRVFQRFMIAPPGSVCSHTFLVLGAFDSKEEAINLKTYMKTRFAQFLVAATLCSHSLSMDKFRFVPVPDLQRQWTDCDLYRHYDLSADQVKTIRDTVLPWGPEFFC